MKWEKYIVQGISEGMGRSLLREGTKYKDHGYKRSKQGTVDEERWEEGLWDKSAGDRV